MTKTEIEKKIAGLKEKAGRATDKYMLGIDRAKNSRINTECRIQILELTKMLKAL